MSGERMTTPTRPSSHEHDLEHLGFEAMTVRITATSSEAVPQIFSLRLLLPKADDAASVGWEHLLSVAQQATGADRTFYRWVIRMAQFYQRSSELDPHRARRFNLNTLNHSEAFQRMEKMKRLRGAAAVDRLITFAGETVVPMTTLLHEAIYQRAKIRVPLSQPFYLQFRKRFLAECEKALDATANRRREVIAQQPRTVPSDDGRSSQRIRNRLLNTASQIEAQHAAQFADLVEEAVRQGLAAFRDILGELTPAERRRAFELLVKEVVYTQNQVT